MKFLVTYDVPQEYNPVRNRIVQVLKNYGLERIEYSVFLGNLSRNEAEMLSMRLEDIVKAVPADVRLFALCQNCLGNSIVVKEKIPEWEAPEKAKGVEFI